MLSTSEQSVMQVFRTYMVTPGQMLCFGGTNLQRHKTALRNLAERELVIKEKVDGGYSLTKSGYAAMMDCT